jgi:cytochrome c oxidase assembly protein subunit 11
MTTLDLAARNKRVGRYMVLLVAAMVGLGFASVPLYRMFCQVTGFDGTTMRKTEADLPKAPVGKIISVRFDANVSPALKWQFVPEKLHQPVAIGARQMAFFHARNVSDKTITGTATFNVSPSQSGQYFSKIQCFCFTEQTLKPGEDIRMPVVFFVDPAILDNPDTRDISEITLSYTFYPVDSAKSAG